MWTRNSNSNSKYSVYSYESDMETRKNIDLNKFNVRGIDDVFNLNTVFSVIVVVAIFTCVVLHVVFVAIACIIVIYTYIFRCSVFNSNFSFAYAFSSYRLCQSIAERLGLSECAHLAFSAKCWYFIVNICPDCTRSTIWRCCHRFCLRSSSHPSDDSSIFMTAPIYSLEFVFNKWHCQAVFLWFFVTLPLCIPPFITWFLQLNAIFITQWIAQHLWLQHATTCTDQSSPHQNRDLFVFANYSKMVCLICAVKSQPNEIALNKISCLRWCFRRE